LDKIVSFGDGFASKSKRKEKVTNEVVAELNAFDQQRLDALDTLLVAAMDSEHKLGLALQLPEDAMPLIAEAKNLDEARQENFSPKLNMSLKHLLTNPNSIEYLKCFFRKRQMVEGLQFWLEVQKFKQLDAPLVDAGARFIYELYVQDGGARQVNLASEDSDPIHKNIKNPTRTIFDSAAKNIATLLEDNLDGFHSSVYYRQMLAHFQPLRSFQEFVADVGGPPNASKASSGGNSGRKSHHQHHHAGGTTSGAPPTLMSLRNSIQGSNPDLLGSKADDADDEATEIPLISQVLDIHRTISLPELTVSCMTPGPNDVLCGCLDGSIISLKYDKQATSLESTEVVPSGAIEGKILTIIRHSPAELFVLTDRGRVFIYDLTKKKATVKVTKGDPFATGLLRIDSNRIWICFGKTIQDWHWNTKKKKYTAITTRELPRAITSMVRIENTVWVGDELGGVTRLHLSTLHPLNERLRISTSSPVHFIHKSEFTRHLKDFTSTTARVWVSCRDSVTHVYDSDGNLVQRQDTSVHDLPIIGAANLERHVVLASEDGSLSVWHSESLTLVERIGRIHKDSISAIAANADQKLVYTAGLDRLIATWGTKNPVDTPSSNATTLPTTTASAANSKASTIPSVNAANAAIKRKQSRGASGRSKSLLDSSPLQALASQNLDDPLNPDQDDDSSPAFSPGRSFTVTVDSLLQLSRHPEEASSLTTHRGLGSSSATDENDYEFQRHTRGSRNSSTDSFGKRVHPDSARSNGSNASGHSSSLVDVP
jgi:hypothetical protein